MAESLKFGTARSAGEHYLVAVSGSRNSEYLIRWAAAAVRRGGGVWTAMHVRSADGEGEQTSLEANLDLARRLGADVISIPAEDVASALVRYARIKRATALVIGKTDSLSAAFRERKSVMERILRESGDLNIVLLRGDSPDLPRKRREAVPFASMPLRDYLLVFGIMGAVTVFGFVVHWFIGYRSIAVFYLLGIISVALVAGRGAVFLGAALSALGWNFVFVPPTFGFAFRNWEDAILFSSFFLSALFVGFLTSRLKRNEAVLSVREERMAMLYGFSRLLSRTRGTEEIAAVSASYLSYSLGAKVSVLLRGRNGRLEVDEGQAGRVDEAVAERCLSVNGQETDADGRWYFPLTSPDHPLGVLVVEGIDKGEPPGEVRELFATISGNIGLAVEREAHKSAAESERLSRTLLNHVSHELRTPLTTIKGSVSALLETQAPSAATEESAFRVALLTETLAAADKLNDVVENLLAISRLETGALRPHPEATDLMELFGAARDSLREELGDRQVLIDPSCADVDLFADPALMVQVIRNLLRNFAAYTPVGATLRVSAGTDGEFRTLLLADDGPGVPLHELPRLFETFSRGSNGARMPGCGLGLSICRGIVEAHGGTISAQSGTDGGFAVTIRVPIKE
jgi:two-component system sensor histidine kinase KdpD